MKRFVMFICLVLLTSISFSQEVIPDFKEKSIPVLNDELSKIRKDLNNINQIIDSDRDTKIQVEESVDEDIIRFDSAGTERATLGVNGLKLATGADVTEFSIDGTLGGNSDDAVPTEKAVKTYVDGVSSIKVGSFTHDLSVTGPEATTGVGFQPSGVILFALTDHTDEMSIGFDDGTNAFSIADDSPTSAGTYEVNTTRSINIVDTSASMARGYISSFDSDGFTITWEKTSSPSGTLTIGYMAF